MGPMRTIDILRKAEQFHQQLSAYYASLGRAAHREEVKQLLDYMSRHELYLGHCIQEYERGGSKSVMEAWFKISPQFPMDKWLSTVAFTPEMTTEEVAGIAMQLDAYLLQIYEMLINRATSQELRASLANLLEMEKREEIKIMRSALTN